MSWEDDLQLREMVEPHWFRVEAENSYEDGARLVVEQIPVLKHTPKGAWVHGRRGERRLVLREYLYRGRAFAAPTRHQALEDFRLRKRFQIARLQAELNWAKRQLELLDE